MIRTPSYCFLPFLLAFAGIQLPAQETLDPARLVVDVRDSAGVPIPGVAVSVNEARTGTGLPADLAQGESDVAGRAVFEGLAPGAVSIVAMAEGFFPNEAAGIELMAGQETQVSVALEVRSVVSETLVVTGTGTEYLAQEAPVRTELLTQELVTRQVKTTLAEAFQASLPGVRMEMNCQNCGLMQIRMNGLEGGYTQILEDGLPNYSGVTSVYGLEQIPTAFIDQIEVVKGGNSALYGPNAVAGVVNLIRREPRENRFRIDTMTGWHWGRPEQQLGSSAQIVDIPGGFSGDFFYRGINRVSIDRDRDGFSDIGKRQLQSGGFGLYRQFLDGTARLNINGAIYDEFRRGGDQFEKPPHESMITEQIDSRRYATSIGWNHSLSPTTFYNLRGSYAYLGRNTYYGGGMDPKAYGDTRNPLWVSDAQVGHQKGRHSILGGYQAWWEFVQDNAPAYNRTQAGAFTNHGMYLQDEWRQSEKFTLIGGVRVDKSNQVSNWIFSPRAGTRLAITENLIWRTSVSTGFRAPQVFNEDLHISQVGGEGFLYENHPELEEEKSMSLSTGIDYVGMMNGKRYTIGGNYFYTDLRDAFTFVEADDPDLTYRLLWRVNGPGAHVTGVDLNGDIRLRRDFGLRAGFTFQRARWDEPEEQFQTYNFFRTPQRYGFVSFDWEAPLGLDVVGTYDYTGSMEVPHYAGYIPEDRLEFSKDFHVFNLVVSKLFDVTDDSKMRIYFNLQNIGDAYQPDLDRGPDRDAGYVYGPGEMRRAVIGLTYEF
jgi:outer membrane receptor for ferrienterochelin and colicins